MYVNPHQVTRDFEAALCEYTGAPFAVTTNSCTMSILLSMKWLLLPSIRKSQYENLDVWIPKNTYISVPMSVVHAGGYVFFDDREWSGSYELKSTTPNMWSHEIWDSARRFTSGMYRGGQMQCCSFHASKILGDSQGGCILHDDPDADDWLRKARFDGRTEGVVPKDDRFDMIGHHCYMSPDVAARLLWKLSVLRKHNPDLPNDDYPDLSQFEVFK